MSAAGGAVGGGAVGGGSALEMEEGLDLGEERSLRTASPLAPPFRAH